MGRRSIFVREVAKWGGILWMAASVVFILVIWTIEAEERRPLLLPVTGGLGEITLLTLVFCVGYRLYCWGVRYTP